MCAPSFDWVIGGVDKVIVHELFAISDACYIATNGQPKFTGGFELETEYLRQFPNAEKLRIRQNKTTLENIADRLFGNECDFIYLAAIDSEKFDTVADSLKFTPFWHFVFLSSQKVKPSFESPLVFLQDSILLRQQGVVALVYLDRVACFTGIAVIEPHMSVVRNKVGQFFLMNESSISDIFSYSIFSEVGKAQN